MGWAAKTIVGTVLTVSAFMVGSYAGAHTRPEPPKPKVVTVPRYIAGPTKTVTKNVVPEACRDAIQRAADVQAATQRYEADLGNANELLDESWRAAQSGDVRQVNKVKQKHIDLINASIEDLQDLTDAEHDLAQLKVKCEAQVR